MINGLYCKCAFVLFCLILTFWAYVGHSLGCIGQICQSNARNTVLNANCTVHRKHCGSYGGKRSDGSLLYGLDISCAIKSPVFAPLPGNLSFHRPRGGQNGSECIDHGLKISGAGRWSGYTAVVSYINPIKFTGHVDQNDVIGYALDLTCATNARIALEPHVVLQLYFQGRPIDPTYRISDCMCTGQICTSNSMNDFIDKPFKHKKDFGKGYELQCIDTKLANEEEIRLPEVLSPVEAKFLGRFRPWNYTIDGNFLCQNDGVFLIGDGKWTDFVVHIYNVKFTREPGYKHIGQGEAIAQRLRCPNTTIDSIFVEFRYKGKLVNVTKLISAADCKLPEM